MSGPPRCGYCRMIVARRAQRFCPECRVLHNRRQAVRDLAELILREHGLKRPELAERLALSERAIQDRLLWALDPLYAPSVTLRYTAKLDRAKGYRWLPGTLDRATLSEWSAASEDGVA